MINKGESIFYFILIIFFSYLCFESLKIPAAKGGAVDVGANFFPISIAIILIILAIFLFIRSLKITKKDTNSRSQKEFVNNLRRNLSGSIIMLVALIILIGYVILLKKIGFVYSTIFFLVILTLILHFCENNKKIDRRIFLKTSIFSILFTITVYYIFNNFFNIILP